MKFTALNYSLFTTLSYIFLCSSQQSEAKNAAQPNVLVLLWDDAGWGSFNQDNPQLRNLVPGTELLAARHMYTPNLDRVIQTGIRFSNAYVGSPLCSPSRYSFTIGMRTDQTNYRDNDVSVKLNISSQPTIAKVFKAHGYETVKFGKHPFGIPGSLGSPQAFGYDNFLGYCSDTEAHFVYPTYLWRQDGSKLILKNNLKASIKTCAQASSPCSYASDIFLQEFMNFIKNRNASKPFFMELAFTQPHVGAFITNHKKLDCLIPQYGQYTNKTWAANYKGFAAMVSYIDYLTGEIFNTLNFSGILNNTLVIFTSDNGGEYDPTSKRHKESQPLFFQDNGGLRLRKRFMFEGGVRVPFFATWPGMISANIVSSVPIALYDLLKTFNHLLAINDKKSVINDPTYITSVDQAVSILPILFSKDGKANGVQRKYLSTEFCLYNQESNCKFGFYKTENNDLLKLVYDVSAYDVLGFGVTNPKSLQLYNLTNDPREENNLINNPDYTALIEELSARRQLSRFPLQ